MMTDKNKTHLYNSNLQENLNTKRTPLIELTLNPLKIPLKHPKAFAIKLLTGIATLSFLTAQIGQASASPTVIYNIHNNGKTVKTIDAQPFYPFKRFVSSDLEHIPRYTTKAIKRFPIVSPMLSIGKVKNTKIRSKLPRAICVIGDDNYSKKWLQDKHMALNANNALCMVVNVDSQQRFNAIEARTPSVEFQALNGDTIARALNIKHYPFLLDNGFISQ